MRKLYLIFNNSILTPLVSKLSWSNLIVLMSIKESNQITYYANQSIKMNLSKRQLEKLIKSNEYERLPNRTKNKLISKEEYNIDDFIKNPIIIKNTNNINIISEKVLKDLILENIDLFLKELGEGFSYIGNEYKIKIDDRSNYIDILLFNIKFNCYVVVELKVTELKKEHIGQIEIYMNYVNKHIKSINHEDTIGIIITKKDNYFVIGYKSDPRIYNTTYILN